MLLLLRYALLALRILLSGEARGRGGEECRAPRCWRGDDEEKEARRRAMI